VVGSVHVVEAGSSRATAVVTHPDLPKHAYGCCPVCTRRLVAAKQNRPVERTRRSATDLPTRFLVQTSPVSDTRDGWA